MSWEIEQLTDEFSEVFGRKADLLSMRSLHPLLRESVLAEGRAAVCSVTSCRSLR